MSDLPLSSSSISSFASGDALIAAMLAAERQRAPVPAALPDGPALASAPAPDVAVDVLRKPRRGRRRLAGEAKRAHCYSVRANVDEQKAIEAKRGKLPAGEFLRLAAIGFQPVPAVPAINEQAWTELSRVGSNLNQIAKRLNGSDAAREATQLLDVLRELRFALHGAKLPEPKSPVA